MAARRAGARSLRSLLGWRPLRRCACRPYAATTERQGPVRRTSEIRGWIANRRQQQADYTRPQEIGSAKGRPSLLVRAVLDGVAYCCLKTAKTIWVWRCDPARDR